MDGVIVMQSVTQVLLQLGEETGGYEGGGCGVYTWFALSDEKLANIQTTLGGRGFIKHGYGNTGDYLATRKTDSYYSKLVVCGQELGGNCGRRSHYC